MEIEETTAMLNLHLEKNNLCKGDSRTWFIGKSLLGGRGLFATRDIGINELIFVDAPLVVGPRSRDKHLPICAGCYKAGSPLFPCDGGCGLPICSTECELSSKHKTECYLLKAWKPTCGSSWSVDLLRAVVPIRSLGLDAEQRKLVYALHWNSGEQHGLEIDLLKSNVKTEINKEDEEFMRRVCDVLDTNSFETAALVDKSVTSLRGLYPMGALQNHSCAPNTRHHFDCEQKLYVIAAVPIKKGEEITMTYTDLFWDTTLRRRHLAGTKHFSCECNRCADPLENGSLLGALLCANENCPGVLIAMKPLNNESERKCTECGLIMKNRQIISIRSGLGSIVEELIYQNPRQILAFIKGELSILVPATNYIMVDMKLRIISYLGRIDKYLWQDLSQDELKIKEKYCRDLLSLIKTLKCGECKMKGSISFELYSTLVELRKRRINSGLNYPKETESLWDQEITNLLMTAVLILEKDITAPRDLFTAVCDLEMN